MATGLLNIQYDYLFGFSFYTAHYYGGWIFLGAFAAHVTFKLPVMIRALRSRSLLTELRTSRRDTQPERADSDLVAAAPAAATISRRGALALVGGGAALIAVLTAGQSIGGITRYAALLLPRGRRPGDGPTGSPSTAPRLPRRSPRPTPRPGGG
ncbi:hypothetical protein M8542_47920 [Amycolatopsis sp. OK19-0408]|uniref:Uncharacterized protein n=1 Tax=Amycolatopsis iheyensis TaxID=2945988 RepID=A0A9X2SRI3_9PSEU|nr:hypothetical protein [Amycolatopsis iheyensis]MCR6490556.1 hypothetical protein [Amycolatopsis iheyensis]